MYNFGKYLFQSASQIIKRLGHSLRKELIYAYLCPFLTDQSEYTNIQRRISLTFFSDYAEINMRNLSPLGTHEVKCHNSEILY